MTAFAAVLFYIAWMLILAVAYAGPRIPLVLSGAKAVGSWERDQPPVDPPFLQRAKSAHMNCVENFPLFAAVVVIAALMNRIEVANTVAAYVLYARIAQSLVHISGTSFVQVMIRATCFLTQVGLIAYMVYRLLAG